MNVRRFAPIRWRDPQHQRALLILTGLIFLVALLISCTDGDYSLFFTTSRLFLNRQDPYSFAAHWENFGRGFPYPPGALFLTLLPSLLPFGFSLLAWDFSCLLLCMAAIYLWCEILEGHQPNFPHFVHAALISFIAPCLWSFFFHHLTMPIFFFATYAVWLLQFKRASFGSGASSGLMLIKPHLTLFLALWLFVKTPKKGLFLLGLLVTLLLPFLPFVSGYRPLSDLQHAWQSTKIHARQMYLQDDQGIVANIYRSWINPSLSQRLQIYNRHARASILVPTDETLPLTKLKTTAFFLALAGWGLSLRSIKRESLGKCAVLALALGLLFSPYSHLYDGILLIPFILLAALGTSDRIKYSTLACLSFFINFAFMLFLPLGFSLSTIHWSSTGWCTLLYLVLWIFTFKLAKSGFWTQFLHKCNVAVTLP